MAGTFFTTRGGQESKLILNNKSPESIDVMPILYGENGAILQIPIFTVEHNSHLTVNLQDWATLGGDEFGRGNLKLFHRGKDLSLGTQIQILDSDKRLVFENKLSEMGKFDSRRLEGVWWTPKPNQLSF